MYKEPGLQSPLYVQSPVGFIKLPIDRGFIKPLMYGGFAKTLSIGFHKDSCIKEVCKVSSDLEEKPERFVCVYKALFE